MPVLTENIALKKPFENEVYDISVQNENMDILDTAIFNKVDKIDGLGLSEESFTASDKEKLLGIEENATNYVHPTKHSANMIDEETNRKFMTDDEKTKLLGIQTGATNYVHPNNSTTRHVTDSEKSNWNSKASGNHSHSNYLPKSNISNNLTTTQSGYVLDARQGKILSDKASKDKTEIGEILTFSYEYDNPNYLLCDGGVINREDYPLLIGKLPTNLSPWEIDEPNVGVHVNSIAYGANTLVAVGDGARYKLKGGSWTYISSLKNRYFRAVTYGKDRFVAVGEEGVSFYSLDGITWVYMSGLPRTYMWGVTYGKDRFVAVGYYNSHYSLDGLTWKPMTGLPSNVSNLDVTYGKDRFVSVGSISQSYYSLNGLSWQPMTGMSNNGDMWGVTYGKDRFVAVGKQGSSYYSINGASWQPMSGLPNNTFSGVSYRENTFVAVGELNLSYYSSDGLTWLPINGYSSSAGSINAIAYGDGTFMSVSGNSILSLNINYTLTLPTNLNLNQRYDYIKALE